MVPHHYDPATGLLKLSIHSWLVEIGGRKILIDTCVGNHKSRKARPFWDNINTPWLERLAAAGVKPEEIDMVMCTHLHVDHVGWNTRLDNGSWVPTFPNAKYIWSKTDFDYFSGIDRDPQKGARDRRRDARQRATRSSRPGSCRWSMAPQAIEEGHLDRTLARPLAGAFRRSSSTRRARRRSSAAT